MITQAAAHGTPQASRAVPSSARAIVAASHLVSKRSLELVEFEFGLSDVWNAFSRQAVRCRAAAGAADLTITDVLVLHHICHRAHNGKVAELCFVLIHEVKHVVAYPLKKLPAAGLAPSEKIGKEVLFSPSPAGEGVVQRCRQVREACLVDDIDGERHSAIGERALHMHMMSSLCDQAARAATSL